MSIFTLGGVFEIIVVIAAGVLYTEAARLIFNDLKKHIASPEEAAFLAAEREGNLAAFTIKTFFYLTWPAIVGGALVFVATARAFVLVQGK